MKALRAEKSLPLGPLLRDSDAREQMGEAKINVPRRSVTESVM